MQVTEAAIKDFKVWLETKRAADPNFKHDMWREGGGINAMKFGSETEQPKSLETTAQQTGIKPAETEAESTVATLPAKVQEDDKSAMLSAKGEGGSLGSALGDLVKPELETRAPLVVTPAELAERLEWAQGKNYKVNEKTGANGARTVEIIDPLDATVVETLEVKQPSAP